MPKATVSTVPIAHPLTTLPEGFVKIRRMSYGELLASQDMAYQISVKQSEASDGDPDMGVKMTQAAILEYQFKTCIVDHNLEDDSGQMLDFRQPQAVHLLDPLIGQEINSIIEKTHRWDKKFPNLSTPSTSASSTNGAAGMAKEPLAILVPPVDEVKLPEK